MSTRDLLPFEIIPTVYVNRWVSFIVELHFRREFERIERKHLA